MNPPKKFFATLKELREIAISEQDATPSGLRLLSARVYTQGSGEAPQPWAGISQRFQRLVLDSLEFIGGSTDAKGRTTSNGREKS